MNRSGTAATLSVVGLLAAIAAVSRGGRGSPAESLDLVGPPRWHFKIVWEEWGPGGLARTGLVDHGGDELDVDPATTDLPGTLVHTLPTLDAAADVADHLGVSTALRAGAIQIPPALRAAYTFWQELGGHLTGEETLEQDQTGLRFTDRGSLRYEFVFLPFKSAALGGRLIEKPWPEWMAEWIFLYDQQGAGGGYRRASSPQGRRFIELTAQVLGVSSNRLLDLMKAG